MPELQVELREDAYTEGVDRVWRHCDEGPGCECKVMAMGSNTEESPAKGVGNSIA
jgi:hypothetical protein